MCSFSLCPRSVCAVKHGGYSVMVGNWVDMAVVDLQRRAGGVLEKPDYENGVPSSLEVPPEAQAVFKSCLVAAWMLAYQDVIYTVAKSTGFTVKVRKKRRGCSFNRPGCGDILVPSIMVKVFASDLHV